MRNLSEEVLGLFLPVAFVVKIAAFSASAQSASATLSGTVVDEQGAVVAGAMITITDAARGKERQTTTNSSGFFTFVQLQPVSYSITAANTGFRKH